MREGAGAHRRRKPKHVTFLGKVFNLLDDDGLANAWKPLRDELVASGVLSGDAPNSGNTSPMQFIERLDRGVRIRVELI